MLSGERDLCFCSFFEDSGKEGVVVGAGLAVIVIDEEDDVGDEEACDEDCDNDGGDFPFEYFGVFSLFDHERFILTLGSDFTHIYLISIK